MGNLKNLQTLNFGGNDPALDFDFLSVVAGN